MDKQITVKDLIKELLEYNMNAEVVTAHSETIMVSCIDADTIDKKTTPFVFIDGCDYVKDEND